MDPRILSISGYLGCYEGCECKTDLSPHLLVCSFCGRVHMPEPPMLHFTSFFFTLEQKSWQVESEKGEETKELFIRQNIEGIGRNEAYLQRYSVFINTYLIEYTRR